MRMRSVRGNPQQHVSRGINQLLMLIFATLMLGGAVFAQTENTRPVPSMQDPVRGQYTPNDYQNFLQREKNGEVPQQRGPVYSKASGDALSISNLADVLVNNNAGATGTAGFTQSETSILAFGNTVVAGFNDSGSNAGGSNKFTGWSWSTDGGATFTDGGTLPTNPGGDAGDPVLARNESTGRIYYSTLGFTVSTIQVFRSDDNGVTWTAPVNGTPGGSSEDKQWMTVDNFPGAGNGNVYILSRRFGSGPGIYFFRSTDNGNTFGPNLGTLITSGAQGAFVAVGPDHSIYAFWWGGTTILMRKSTDQGATFGPTVTVATGLVGGTNGDLALTGIRQGTVTASSFRSNSFPHAAVNPVSGHVYVTFNDNPAGTDKADVYLVMSSDGGATWSARTRVNDDATTTDQWQPTLAVTPDGLTLGVFYSSRQEDPANNLFKYYGRTAVISGSTLTFFPSFAISDVASLPEFGRDSVVNSTYMGDYNHAAATPGYFHVLWSDNRDDLAGGAPRKDPNIYYERIQVGLQSGPNITISPANVSFGSVAVTATAGPSVITVLNTGDAPLTVSSITSPAADFSLTVPALPAVIPSLGSIALSASFAPVGLGAQNSSFTITSNAVNTPVAIVNLSGTGVTNIAVSPLSVSFGDVPVGQTGAPASVTVQNNGGVNLTISAISTPAGDFSLSHPALPLVLPPLGNATLDVSFSPTSAGLQSSSFDIASDAIGTPTVTVNLDGNGIIAPANDLCVNAIPVDCGMSIDGTTVLATFDNVGTCGTSNTAPGVWYTVQGTGAPISVETCAAASYDTKISVFSGSCGALVCVGGNDDACSLRSRVTFPSVSGTTYYVLVHGFLSATGTFTLSVSSCPAEIAVAPDSLVIVAPLNSTAAGQLTISNPAGAGALDLLWTAYSAGTNGPGNGLVSVPSYDGVNREPLYQITEQTMQALSAAHLPGVIRNALATLVNAPPANKDDFRQSVVAVIGEERTNEIALVLFENSIVWIEDESGKESAATGSIVSLAAVGSLPSDGIFAAGGPDAFGYEFIDSDEPGGPTFSWIDITGTGTAVTLSDDSSVLVPLPFVFPFYGAAKTDVRIGSNGYLTFGTSGSTFSNTDIPNAANPNDIICPFWDDLNPSTGGTVHYFSSPTQFIVQYTNIKRFGTSTGPNTFEVVLNADGSILLQYLDMQSLLTSATVGIENSTGTVGLKAVFNGAYIHNNLAVSIALPPPCSWITSVVPSAGTVPAGGSQLVTVNVDATGLLLGIYGCEVVINSNAVNTARVVVPVTLIVGTPTERIDDLIAKILALRAAGVLNDGQANSMIVKLQAAKSSIQRGKPNTAINQLNAFVNEVNAYMNAGTLTAQQGGQLIDCAQRHHQPAAGRQHDGQAQLGRHQCGAGELRSEPERSEPLQPHHRNPLRATAGGQRDPERLQRDGSAGEDAGVRSAECWVPQHPVGRHEQRRVEGRQRNLHVPDSDWNLRAGEEDDHDEVGATGAEFVIVEGPSHANVRRPLSILAIDRAVSGGGAPSRFSDLPAPDEAHGARGLPERFLDAIEDVLDVFGFRCVPEREAYGAVGLVRRHPHGEQRVGGFRVARLAGGARRKVDAATIEVEHQRLTANLRQGDAERVGETRGLGTVAVRTGNQSHDSRFQSVAQRGHPLHLAGRQAALRELASLARIRRFPERSRSPRADLAPVRRRG